MRKSSVFGLPQVASHLITSRTHISTIAFYPSLGRRTVEGQDWCNRLLIELELVTEDYGSGG